ncbi:hypothetical protein [Absidia glauca]|uniref:Retrotransposon gag domain-containing protein n=1 Tax=Absidia glauca TaxID=4829 RepID=A0A168P713_ABSGL|nr:hypothetical protein [Absidia glauca]
MFEMILYQHDLVLDDAWEQCMISAVQRSTDKSQRFQNNLMGKAMDWMQAKSMVQDKFSGDQVQAHYSNQLVEMRASKYDTPVNFIDRFETTLRSTGTPEKPGYGTILLKAFAGNHPTFPQQVRLAYAAAPRHLRPPMDVSYIASIAPILNDDRPIRKPKQERSAGHQEHLGKKKRPFVEENDKYHHDKKVRFDKKVKVIQGKEEKKSATLVVNLGIRRTAAKNT